MAVLTVEDVTPAGLGPTYASASAGGDSFANDGNTILHVKNGDTVVHTVTIVSAKTCNQGFQHNLSVSVGAGADTMIGPFAMDRFNNDQGQTAITYDGVTLLTVAALAI